ncbi:GT2 family glycosyltransferase [Mucilaginibacter frigoritolerans]|jgi:GT2 family glycosyltransferase|uniref:GT2 family glycosyltransferase n=1 Tax=Mucilaginibacter frigoritolerans TaxID=652788 RepID=A0A562U535_9SPHI|nr:glycosyltransferase [Mucilaginibacter frigoritolerans]TWJ00639.1 GT2 family glycosyltransferase [Mucilaginibacter frigoritolerans]
MTDKMTGGPKKEIKIAALSCSYNRLKKTTAFLTSLVNQKVSDNYKIDAYLLDDNSSDGTASYVESHFPTVNVLNGSGSLFWAGGMRTLWEHVVKKEDYDFYLLFNDDVVLFEGALGRLLSACNSLPDPGNIILGTLQDSNGSAITYGGQKIINKFSGDTITVTPDPFLLTACEIGNANIMLVDKSTVDKIGILSGSYTHGIADYDYTLTAIKNGVNVWIAPGYYGHCDDDHGVTWLSQSTPLKKRIEFLYSPKGLAYKQHMLYVKKHFPLSVPTTHIKFWVKTLFPIVYDVFKKEEKVKN